MKQIVFLFLFLSGLTAFAQQQAEKAYTYYRKGEYEQAALLYKPLLEKNPIRRDYFKYLLTCYQQLEDYKSAESLIRSQMKKFPRFTYLYVELGYNFQLQGDRKKANAYYQKALDAVNKNPIDVYVTGQAFRQNNLLDKAMESYRIALEKNPKLNLNAQMAQVYGELGDLENMFIAYLDLIEQNEKYYPSVQRYIGKFITSDPEDPTNLLFKKILLKRSQNNPKTAYNALLSWLYMQQNQYDKALIQEKSVYMRTQKGLDKIAEIGKIAFQNHDFTTSKKAFEFVLQNSTNSESTIEAEDYIIRGKIKTARNPKDYEKIDQDFERLFKKYGINAATIDLQLTYADFLTFQYDQPEKAIALLETTKDLANSPFKKGKIKNKLADILVYTGKFNTALILYSQVQTELKNSVIAQEARFKVARTSYFKGDFDWAQIQLKVLKSSTSQLIANDALELSLLISNNIPKDSATTPLKQFAKAQLLSYQRKNGAAIDTLEVILKNYKGMPIEQEALKLQAELFKEQGDFTAAESVYLKLYGINPQGIYADDACFALAELYRKELDQPEKAKTYYEKIIFEYPASIYLVDARKYYRMLRGDVVQ